VKSTLPSSPQLPPPKKATESCTRTRVVPPATDTTFRVPLDPVEVKNPTDEPSGEKNAPPSYPSSSVS